MLNTNKPKKQRKKCTYFSVVTFGNRLSCKFFFFYGTNIETIKFTLNNNLLENSSTNRFENYELSSRIKNLRS